MSTTTDSTTYQSMMKKQQYLAGAGGIEGALDKSGCDLLLAPAGSLIVQSFAAMAGPPAMNVPMGFYPAGTDVKVNDKTGQILIAPNVP